MNAHVSNMQNQIRPANATLRSLSRGRYVLSISCIIPAVYSTFTMRPEVDLFKRANLTGWVFHRHLRRSQRWLPFAMTRQTVSEAAENTPSRGQYSL